jgi:hypothetical protein
LRTTRSVVDPKIAWSSTPLPWVPSTIMSAVSSRATRMISCDGLPWTTSVRTFKPLAVASAASLSSSPRA